MVEWSIDAFRAAAGVHSIVVACPPGLNHDLAGADLDVVDGGRTRSESVANALRAVHTELVAVHDAARPLLTPQLVEELIGVLANRSGAAGVIAAAPVTDTIKQVSPAKQSTAAGDAAGANAQGGHPASGPTGAPLGGDRTPNGALVIESTLDRSRLWAAQTPQLFRAQALRAVLAAPSQQIESATDEAMLVELAGGEVLLHPSSPQNIKVTTPLDLRLAESLLAERH